ncbi:MAG: A24 family peptidase [Chloroflexi bacterium]|nr:A24 family peptidase [Chloroflexota bacterium]MCC6891215.1 prepilin peptidase [Anaerolineae bacterium]
MIVPILLIAIAGILAGGIVNVLADDLPERRPIRLPHYPDNTPRPITAWLGITAFAFGQRKSPNGVALSSRYPLAEIATAVGMIVTYLVKVNEPKVDSLQLVYWLIYVVIFVLITVIDIEHKLILFVVIIPSCILAIVDAFTTLAPPNLERSLLGGALGFGTFFVLYLGGIAYVYIANQVQGRNISEIAFGYGDVMMALLSGLILGLGDMLFAMFVTVILGALGALLYLVGQRVAGRGASMITALPYGPYIVAGTLLMMLFGPQIRIFLVGYAN